MNLIFFDTPTQHLDLSPLTLTRPLADLRIGILKIAEKWKYWFSEYFGNQDIKVSFLTPNYLSTKFPLQHDTDNFYINGGLLPNKEITRQIFQLFHNEVISNEQHLLAARTDKIFNSYEALVEGIPVLQQMNEDITIISQLWHIFEHNRNQIIADFEMITKGRKSQPITDPHTIAYAKDNIFLEEGAVVKAAILDAENAPIYLGKNSLVEIGCIIRGAFALCEGASLNFGAKMRGDTTIGVFSKFGGEVSNVVVQGYSNKAHDGYLGNSVIGEWCNMGADTNSSNLKNTFKPVSIWNYRFKDYINTEKLFCGTFMGDFVRCGINTMLNTGTVIGVGANVFGADFPPKFVPDFAWGGAAGFVKTQLDKLFETASVMKSRRGQTLTKEDKAILTHLYASS
ncbi:putative sugar nucleotidyl transferase [Thermoflexibacter ruber]|uniref:UDP-N-acetylglucosamine diphosphorylase/glucosamine-1-phosphate N-acetyltransferase n=1 Tax=Thermoflexibacter ruber TaxID=1003 RepID=A0A1I2H0D2_9BACT|nr:putative sugar nucleotidyl transferase [Thermoflexibacter ruber]SFF22988.1 UDP-N-acetylglucosamine diphosphorylase/glucosamine-1-phosphate N-acetyltransferase [Thermoflexibacter ruber]